jgi:hypothetical protein
VGEPFQGTIRFVPRCAAPGADAAPPLTGPDPHRQRDVRAFDIDSVDIYKSFRPGDLVKAEVVRARAVSAPGARWT